MNDEGLRGVTPVRVESKFRIKLAQPDMSSVKSSVYKAEHADEVCRLLMICFDFSAISTRYFCSLAALYGAAG